MKIRLYFDEDTMDKDLVHAIRVRGADVLTALEAGMIERDDSNHLAYATAQGRVLYSYNVGDYHLLHTQALVQAREHAGIILAKQQKYSLGEQVRRLLKLVGYQTAEEMRNSLLFL